MTTRQKQFSGEETAPEWFAIDRSRLADWLACAAPEFGTLERITKFKGGQSNPTFRLYGKGGSLVLRSKPIGALVPSAHQIDREYRIFSALAGTDIPVPLAIAYCADTTVIGAEFCLLSFIEGTVYWEADIPGALASERATLYERMGEVLAAIHNINPGQAGLSDLGPSDGYTHRNFLRWSSNYQQSALVDVPDMNWLIEILPTCMPSSETAALIHGDYGLYNLVVRKDRPDVAAVLDWEMSTIGDPLIDLAHHLRAWWEPAGAGLAATSLADHNLESLGIPILESYIAHYFKRRGMPPCDLRWHIAYAQFRYAAMVQGVLKRAVDGTASARVMVHTQERVGQIAALARHTLEGFLG